VAGAQRRACSRRKKGERNVTRNRNRKEALERRQRIVKSIYDRAHNLYSSNSFFANGLNIEEKIRANLPVHTEKKDTLVLKIYLVLEILK